MKPRTLALLTRARALAAWVLAALLLLAVGCSRPAGKVCPICGTNYGSTAVWCGKLHDGRAVKLVANGSVRVETKAPAPSVGVSSTQNTSDEPPDQRPPATETEPAPEAGKPQDRQTKPAEGRRQMTWNGVAPAEPDRAPTVASNVSRDPNSEVYRSARRYRNAEAAFLAGRYRDALPLLRPLAQAGDARAQYMLGEILDVDDATAREAFRLYRFSALSGDAKGQVLLGWCHATGRGVPKDTTLGDRWYRSGHRALRKEADAGDPLAQWVLAWALYRGVGVSQDTGQALEWYRRAADHGVAWAQARLGDFYRYGRGVPMDPAIAQEWYARADRQGLPYARRALAAIGRRP